MRKYIKFSLLSILTLCIIIYTNPIVSYAQSSDSNSQFVFYLPGGVILAAVLATVFYLIRRMVGKN